MADELTHKDEYEALRDEITMCQHEMHQTWLWATIAAGAVYTWLPSHRSDINNIQLSLLGWSIPPSLFSFLIWLIPPFLLSFCFFRYGVFWFRIRSLADYQGRIEKHAFRDEKDSSAFSVDDFVDLPSLGNKLRQKKRPVDTWLAAQLSPATQVALETSQGSSSDQAPLGTALLQDFNTTVRGSSIYTAERFDGVNLRSETRDLLLKNPQGNGLLRLNRLLLEDAYPLELSRNQLQGFANYNRECLDKKIVIKLPSWRDFFTGAKVILGFASFVFCLLFSWCLPQTISECLAKKIGKWLPSGKHFFTVVGFILWSALIVCSGFLSISLSQTKLDDSLSGQVTDSATHLPIIGATVAVTDSSKAPHVVTTDATGHYVVPSLPTGLATVTAKKAGYDRASSAPNIKAGTNTQDEVLVSKKLP